MFELYSQTFTLLNLMLRLSTCQCVIRLLNHLTAVPFCVLYGHERWRP